VVITREQRVFRELITCKISAGSQSDVPHRLQAIPNIVLPNVVSGKGEIQIISADENKVTLKNVGSEDATIELYVERLHSIEADVGNSDLTGATPTYIDGINNFQCKLSYNSVKNELISSFEDPWIRYVSTTGDDNNDGKTMATAWRNIQTAIDRVPAHCGLALIKIGEGTFEEALVIDKSGGLILAGTAKFVYEKCTINTYIQHGLNTNAKWTEIVVTEDPTEPITWDNTLKTYYIEVKSTTGYVYRGKILDYNASEKRLFVDISSGYPPSSVGYSYLKIIDIKTKIVPPAGFTEYYLCWINGGNSITRKDKSFSYPVCLHNLWFDAGTNKYCLRITEGSIVAIGDVKVENGGSFNTIICYGTVIGFSYRSLSTELQNIIDNYVVSTTCSFSSYNYSEGGGSPLISSPGNSIGVNYYWNGANTPYWLSIYNFGSYNSIYYKGRILLQYNKHIMQFRKLSIGGIWVKENSSYVIRLVTSGCSVDLIGALPNERIRLESGARLLIVNPEQGIKCKEYPSGYDWPMIYLEENSYLLCWGNIELGTPDNPIVSTEPLIMLTKGSEIRCKKMNLYHSCNGPVQTLFADSNSKINADEVNINAQTKPSDETAVVYLNGNSKIFTTGNFNLTNNQVSDGYSIICNHSSFIIGGTKTISTPGLEGGEYYFNSDCRIGNNPQPTQIASRRPVRTIYSNHTLTNLDYCIVVDASSGKVTVTVPPTTDIIGREFEVIKIDSSANSVDVVPNSSTINGNALYSLTEQWSRLKIRAINETTWVILNI